MLEFPTSITNPTSLSEDIYDPAIRSEMEDATVVTRAKTTKMPMTFTIKWSLMKTDDYITFMDFYKQTKGGAVKFTWIHPYTQKQYIVRFKSKDAFNFVHPNYWSGGFTLYEA